MYEPKMALTEEEKSILSGKEGATKAKMMECLVRYGDVFGAKRLAPITHAEGHLVTSFGIPMLGTVYTTMDELEKNGLKAEGGFTVDPRPYDFKNVKCNPLEKLVFSKIMYAKQESYEEQLRKAGLVEKDAFSCTCYLPEMGNTPKKGDVLSWAESSAVAKKFMQSAKYQELLSTGAHLASICPLMYMNNPICAKKRVITNSNKLRTYSTARYCKDEEILSLIATKEGK